MPSDKLIRYLDITVKYVTHGNFDLDPLILCKISHDHIIHDNMDNVKYWTVEVYVGHKTSLTAILVTQKY